jgi:hypothetical protein
MAAWLIRSPELAVRAPQDSENIAERVMNRAGQDSVARVLVRLRLLKVLHRQFSIPEAGGPPSDRSLRASPQKQVGGPP